jgi:putative transposase
MKISRFTDSQIMAILAQNEAGASVPDLRREHGISSASVYKWRAKFSGIDASLMKRMKELEDENRHLKKCTLKNSLQGQSGIWREYSNGL